MIPTPFELATLAAVMAQPGEDPEDTACRAMDLWEACDRLSFRAKEAEKEEQEMGERMCPDYEAECIFLHGLKLGKRVDRSIFKQDERVEPPSFEPGERITLKTFLEASKPNLQSKDEDMQAWWTAFLERQKTGCNSRRFLYDEFTELQIPTDSKEMGNITLWTVFWQDFRSFIARDKKAKGDAKRDKGNRTIKRRAVVKALLAGENTLTKEQLDVLKDVTPEEQQQEVGFFNMDIKDAARLKAAIESAKLPPGARPKTKRSRVH